MSAGQFFLAWTGNDAEDAKLLSFELAQSEGEFATLTAEIPNPRVGLLSSGRPVTATLSWDSGSGLVTLFSGRLIGVPSQISGEAMSVEFLAKPDDFATQKATLAETLKTAPFWDPIFVTAGQDTNPDSVLDARPALWHIDRVSGEVTASDIIAGEDGTLTLAGNYFYDSLQISYGDAPATSINCTAALSWSQSGSGSVDLSDAIESAFAEGGYDTRGLISSYTGGGLVSSWPKTGAGIGGGWTVGQSACTLANLDARLLTVQTSTGGFAGNSEQSKTVNVVFDGAPDADGWINPSSDGSADGFIDPTSSSSEADGWHPVSGLPSDLVGCTDPNFYNDSSANLGGPATVGFQLWLMQATFWVNYDAQRARTETVKFTINADVQPAISANDDTTLDVSLSSSNVDQPVDPDGAIPIGDVRRRSYMLTDRGKQTLEYLIVLCRAKLLARARCVTITFQAPFDDVYALTLRKSVQISDDRLPGGQATGKVTGLRFSLNGDDGALTAEVTMMATIGAGASLAPATAGTGGYADSYTDVGYQASSGGATDIATSDIQYDDFDATPINDDGIDLFAIEAGQIIQSLAVVNGAKQQEYILTSATYADSNAAIAALNDACTKVALALKPISASTAFATEFDITVSDLMVPQTIDLTAGATA